MEFSRTASKFSEKVRRADAEVDCKTARIFAYSSTREQSNERSGTKLKTESETGEKPRFTDFFTDFEIKTDCFAV